jgi:hypothetical protein
VAGQRGLKVLLEHRKKVAEKIRIWGGGQANRDATPINCLRDNGLVWLSPNALSPQSPLTGDSASQQAKPSLAMSTCVARYGAVIQTVSGF